MKATIHCESSIEWQRPFAAKMAEGLYELGIDHVITSQRSRVDTNLAVLLGTTCWREVERTGNYLLVDRCSFGDTNKYVSLVFNGHGRRGNHCVPESVDESRWELHGQLLWRPVLTHSSVVICGQTETYSPHWDRLEDWYATCTDATHFRPHPAGENPTKLPEKNNLQDSGFHVLNSSIAVQIAIEGRPLMVHDEGCMACGIGTDFEDREEWAHWLAWTQWHHDEIQQGHPIAHLFE